MATKYILRHSGKVLKVGGGDILSYSVPDRYREVPSTYDTLSTTSWNDAAAIYSAVNNSAVDSGDRVMFILRHSARTSATGREGGLTEEGKAMVTQYATQKFTGAPFGDTSTDMYMSTDVRRTVETSYLVGKARGVDGMTGELPEDWDGIASVDHATTSAAHKYFNDRYTGSTDWYEVMYYYNNHTAECTAKCVAGVNALAEATEGSRFAFSSSHDLTLIPYVCWAMRNGDEFYSWDQTYEGEPSGWLSYLAGIAVIVHPDGGWTAYPAYLGASGKFA